jgi:hypothetical protein
MRHRVVRDKFFVSNILASAQIPDPRASQAENLIAMRSDAAALRSTTQAYRSRGHQLATALSIATVLSSRYGSSRRSPVPPLAQATGRIKSTNTHIDQHPPLLFRFLTRGWANGSRGRLEHQPRPIRGAELLFADALDVEPA